MPVDVLIDGRAFKVTRELTALSITAKTGQIFTQLVARPNCSISVDLNPEACEAIFPTFVIEETLLAATGIGALTRAAILAGARRETFEIIDGVRRAKAAELAGKKTIRAQVQVGNKVVETRDIPLDKLRSPNKSSIDISSTQRQADRFRRVLEGTKRGDKFEPITVEPGSRGTSIFDVTFE